MNNKTGSVDIAMCLQINIVFYIQVCLVNLHVYQIYQCVFRLQCAIFVNIMIIVSNFVILKTVPRFLKLLKDCVLVSQTELIIYTQTILNTTRSIFPIVFQLLLIACYVMGMHRFFFIKKLWGGTVFFSVILGTGLMRSLLVLVDELPSLMAATIIVWMWNTSPRRPYAPCISSCSVSLSGRLCRIRFETLQNPLIKFHIILQLKEVASGIPQ